MVAISLYRGKLHRSPDVPRQWLMPTPKISLKDFKTLLHRRSRALSRLQATTTPNPNPNPNLNSVEDNNSGGRVPTESDGPGVEDVAKDEGTSKANGDKRTVDDELARSNYADEEVNGQKLSKGDDEDEVLGIPGDELVAVDDAKAVAEVPENAPDAVDGFQQEGKTDAPPQHLLEPVENNSLSDIEKRKKEVEEKLQILNARKHNLVQVLKQILNAEEELRRRSNAQGSTGRPLMPLQVDVGNDNGSMSRHVTPQPVSEGNCNGDTEGADADDGPNQNLRSRSLPRMSSVSPSSDSLHRRAPFAMVPNPSRTPSGVAASSPSRFAPSGQQANPTASVTGTNYVPTSPSPAAGGSLAFRDARLPSPWS
ncbi:uncharacterized protein LOC112514055 [Cynara cardunculus var. scolymus]|uniref:uncharacterized protein LOC112514055 n=1 Tax=Cynara cardunculus var. scolymus TaxID=59895 RepID=UPI000D6301F3|nr:uncharacterized protein LOC112514055 [Cynara cardunculus var. scolymus]